jgi:hypothetical protein
MPFDLEKIAAVLCVLFFSSSVLLVAAALAWRLTLRPTLRALLEYRAARAGDEPVLSRRLAELEQELRALKDRLPGLPEGNPAGLPGTDIPWRGTKQKV